MIVRRHKNKLNAERAKIHADESKVAFEANQKEAEELLNSPDLDAEQKGTEISTYLAHCKFLTFE